MNEKLLKWQKIVIPIVLILLLIIPLITSSAYMLHQFNLFLLYSLIAANWNLLMGYAGIWSMANVAFMVLGAYCSAILTKNIGLPPILCIPISGIASMICVTLFIGLPSLRLRGIYIALLSIMFINTLPTITTQTRKISGGSLGIGDVPPLFDSISRVQSYYIHLTLFILMLFVLHRVIRSKTGLSFIALRDSHELAVALGINEYKEKMKVFALSSFLTGIVGAFYVHYTGFISPAILEISTFIMVLAMVVIGGLGRLVGSVIGAAIIIFGGEWLRIMGTYRYAVLGALICIFILYFPRGIMEVIDLAGNKVSLLIIRYNKREIQDEE